jgi:hypothetical protein
MNSGPHTTKEAAIRLLLGEMGPLVETIETAAVTLNEAHGLIQGDLSGIGQLVKNLELSISNTMDQTTYLLEEIKKVKQVKPLAPAAPVQAAPAAPAATNKTLLIAMFCCALLSSVLSVAGVVLLNSHTLEEARVGRAVSNALPYLEPGVKQKLESAMQKASSQ